MPKVTYQKRMDAALPAVSKEMAKPRVTKSAKIAELNLDDARIRTEASTTVPGIVDKIVPGNPSQPEKADVSLAVLNDGDSTTSPGQNDWRLFVDDIELRDSQPIFLQGEGPIGGWTDLKPGQSLQLSKGLPVVHYFPEERDYKVYWEGKGFRSSTIAVNASF